MNDAFGMNMNIIHQDNAINKPTRRTKPNDDIRRGKWTTEEENYAVKLIEAFNAGLLELPEEEIASGLTLRAFLAQKLCCDPMRITKKFSGDFCLGKRNYHNAEIICPDILISLRNNLRYLEVQFKAKDEEVKKEKLTRELIEKNKFNPLYDFDHMISSPAIDAMVMNNLGSKSTGPLHTPFLPQWNVVYPEQESMNVYTNNSNVSHVNTNGQGFDISTFPLQHNQQDGKDMIEIKYSDQLRNNNQNLNNNNNNSNNNSNIQNKQELQTNILYSNNINYTTTNNDISNIPINNIYTEFSNGYGNIDLPTETPTPEPFIDYSIQTNKPYVSTSSLHSSELSFSAFNFSSTSSLSGFNFSSNSLSGIMNAFMDEEEEYNAMNYNNNNNNNNNTLQYNNNGQYNNNNNNGLYNNNDNYNNFNNNNSSNNDPNLLELSNDLRKSASITELHTNGNGNGCIHSNSNNNSHIEVKVEDNSVSFMSLSPTSSRIQTHFKQERNHSNSKVESNTVDPLSSSFLGFQYENTLQLGYSTVTSTTYQEPYITSNSGKIKRNRSENEWKDFDINQVISENISVVVPYKLRRTSSTSNIQLTCSKNTNENILIKICTNKTLKKSCSTSILYTGSHISTLLNTNDTNKKLLRSKSHTIVRSHNQVLYDEDEPFFTSRHEPTAAICI